MENYHPPLDPSQLSSKDLAVLEEQLVQEVTMVKKLRQYSRQCQNSELKNLCNRLAEKHKNHYGRLFEYLNSFNK